jgi:hypothetical protein
LSPTKFPSVPDNWPGSSPAVPGRRRSSKQAASSYVSSHVAGGVNQNSLNHPVGGSIKSHVERHHDFTLPLALVVPHKSEVMIALARGA